MLRSRTTPGSRAGMRLVPGLAVVACGVAVAFLLNQLLPAVSTLTGAVLLGALAGNLGLIRPGFAPGIGLAGRRLLRVGVALLGLRLALGDVFALGPGLLALIVITVAVTFVGTRRLGRVLGLGDGLSLLIATGFSICGASAVVAMNGVREQDEQDVAKALGLVTLCGSIAMLVLPALQGSLRLPANSYGIWAGASVHEVAQVVAAAAPVGGALTIAVAVKLTRVVLLAPLLAMVSFAERRKATTTTNRPPIIPLFVAMFLLMAVVRSLDVLPSAVLGGAQLLDGLLLTAAMFALGTAVRLRPLLRSGLPVTLLGLLSTVLITGFALGGTALLMIAGR
jgi:uncharacterized integral membrane protein (TIGR00698 family)